MSIKTQEEVVQLRELGKIHAQIIAKLTERTKPGVTTDELEAYACELIEQAGLEPAFKGYRPYGAPRAYPCALCVAPNDVVVHGIPTELSYTLKEGDIIGLDLGVTRDGLIIDAGRTIPVGTIDEQAKKLLRVTEDALMKGIQVARAGNHVGDIGHAIEAHVRKEGFGLVRDLCGHGVGHAVHEEPQVPNFGNPGTGPILEPGMVLAIEPMVNEGKGAVVFERDGYTVTTKDGSRSAHFEHDIVITDGKPTILTLP
jgi:methionyl aminopeptidase